MARAPNEKVSEAYELYKKGYKLIEISRELGIPDGTVRRWKKTYGWDGERSQNNKERSNKKVNKKSTKREPIADEVKAVIENTELNDKQRLFCIIYAKCMNATKAYQKAYECTYETAMVEGSKCLRKPKIKNQIDLLIASECNKEFLQRSILQKYIDIAFADLGDYLKFSNKAKRCWTKDKDGNDIPVVDPDTGEQKIIEYNEIKLRDSNKVDTSLISEISEGKDGIKIKLLDKMKAMEFLTKHCNLLNDNEKNQLDLEYKKLQNEKIKAEINRITGDDDLDVEDDGFMEALNGKALEVWKNE